VVLAATAGSAGCSAAQRPAPGPAVSSTVEHWGSFFGGRHGNFDTLTAPTRLTVPGTVAEVGTSNSTQYALLTDGRLYAWGLGTDGQLGDGRRANSFTRPVRVQFPRGVQVAWIPTDVMPYDTALAVDTTGHVWGWGLNGGGELCRGGTRTYLRPVRLPLRQVTAVAGASNHAIYDAAGTVYACGQNVAGDLGDGRTRGTTTPARVAGLPRSPVVKLVAAFANSGALLTDGKYFDWGYNRQGQLGDGRAGRPSDVPVRVHLPHPVRQVAQGGSLWGNGQTLVLLSNGTLRAWGDDRAYQLGNGRTGKQPSPVRIRPPAGVTYQSLATGSATSYAVTTSGRVYAWGVSHVGQVGNGRTGTARLSVLVAAGATLISATANNVVISVPGQP
jgi:alpha-tubulin suppressor-like RCC1 family protein